MPASDYRALQNQVRELHRLLGKKTLEAEILKDALEHATGSKKTTAAAAAPPSATSNSRRPMVTVIRPSRARRVNGTIARHERAVFTLACWNSCATIADAPNPPLLRASPLAHLRAYFRQHFLVCPFARRDRVFWIDTDIWPAACVDTDPTSCAQRLAFTGKQKTRVVHDAL